MMYSCANVGAKPRPWSGRRGPILWRPCPLILKFWTPPVTRLVRHSLLGSSSIAPNCRLGWLGMNCLDAGMLGSYRCSISGGVSGSFARLTHPFLQQMLRWLFDVVNQLIRGTCSARNDQLPGRSVRAACLALALMTASADGLQ